MEKVSNSLLKLAYAQDASIYQEVPEAVLFPQNTEELVAAVQRAAREGKSLIPRAAGTSLAGQVVGGGIVLDTGRHLNKILDLNIDEGWVEVQPGVIRDELNHHLQPLGYFFGPNTSTSNRCMLGGMVGNNSSGSTSISYGTTREKLLGLEFISADGMLRKVGNIHSKGTDHLPDEVYTWEEDWRSCWHKDNLAQHFPDPSIHRRNSGYAIDLLAELDLQNPDRWLQVLAGSEGTLGITSKIRLRIDPLPPSEVAVLAFHYHSMDDAMLATRELMQHKPYQLELMDRIILDCTKESKEYASYRSFVEGDPAAILLVEFRGTNSAELQRLIEPITSPQSYALSTLLGEDCDRVWKLRAAGLGLLSNVPGDAKPVACIEDTAVKVDVLPEYIRDFDALMQSFGQESVYYAHAGAGELHLRPILNLKTRKGVDLLEDISRASAQLVKKYRGSLSGEHGDGRVRAAFLKEFYGEEVYRWMVDLKRAWDPQGLLNPGKIVNAKPMTADLRYEVDRDEQEIKSVLDFASDGGFLRAVEKCNGSGDCRRLPFTGALMCPSYMASRDEWDSTRGRANVLRSVLTEQSTAGFSAPELAEAMQHCVGCKGCSKECPSGVDMAAMKLEYLYQNRGKRTLGDRIFANFHRAAHAQKLRLILNPLLRSKSFKKLAGIAPERSMPALESGTLLAFYKNYYTLQRAAATLKPILLWVDEFTALQEPQLVGKAADVLESMGFTVAIINTPSGRAQLSGGFLPQAKHTARKATKALKIALEQIPEAAIIGLEPSAVLSARDEYLRLLDGEELAWLQQNEGRIGTLDKFLADHIQKNGADRDKFNPHPDEILLHVHCHQKSQESPGHTAYVLQTLLGAIVNRVKSSCCGMAGSYGMKAKNYDMSVKMAELVLLPAVHDYNGQWIIATGTSCRHQIADLGGKDAAHLVDILWNQLRVEE